MVSVLPAREQGKAFIVSIKYLLCVYGVCAHVCAAPVARSGFRSGTEVWAVMSGPAWVLETELGSCMRAPSALNHVLVLLRLQQSVF